MGGPVSSPVLHIALYALKTVGGNLYEFGTEFQLQLL